MFAEVFVALAVLATVLFHTAGVYFGIQAVMISRTPQAAIGWGLALVFVPYIAIPLFLVFGESRFSGYTLAGAEGNAELDAAIRQAQRALAPFRSPFLEKYSDAERLGVGLRGIPPSGGNACRLSDRREGDFPDNI